MNQQPYELADYGLLQVWLSRLIVCRVLMVQSISVHSSMLDTSTLIPDEKY